MIIHVANITIGSQSGMGRIAKEWQLAFNAKGHQFIHISQEEAGKPLHPLLLGWNLRKYIQKMGWKPSLILAHEPLAGWLKFEGIPLVSFSHGVEERAWDVLKQHRFQNLSLKARLLPSKLRFLSNNKGFTDASICLLSNKTDVNYLRKKKGISHNVRIFRNGYYPYQISVHQYSQPIFLFNASWIPRKGIQLMVESFNQLLVKNPTARLVIAGTGLPSEFMLRQFDEQCRKHIKVYSTFDANTEASIYSEANIFVMPSYFEGQSLALTQAMAIGLCPIAANNSGQMDIINNGFNGLLFETGNSVDFLQKLQWCILNPESVQTLGANAKHSVSQYEWQSSAKQVVEYCEEFL